MQSMSEILDTSENQRIELMKHCEKHGDTKHVKFVFFGKEHAAYCVKCSDEETQARQAKEREEAKERQLRAWHSRLTDNGINPVGKILDEWEFDDSQQERQQKIIAAMQRYANGFIRDDDKYKSLPNMLLIGGTGSGKTMIANHIARTVFHRRYKPSMTSYGIFNRSYAELNPAHLVRSESIIKQIKATWSRESRLTDVDLTNNWAAHDLLVIDDLGDADAMGRDQAAADDRNRISNLINKRYQKAPTIITTNMNQKQVAEFLGDRCWDRLQESLVIIECNWDSYRKQTAKVSYL